MPDVASGKGIAATVADMQNADDSVLFADCVDDAVGVRTFAVKQLAQSKVFQGRGAAMR